MLPHLYDGTLQDPPADTCQVRLHIAAETKRNSAPSSSVTSPTSTASKT